jgi:hypothetical protein
VLSAVVCPGVVDEGEVGAGAGMGIVAGVGD